METRSDVPQVDQTAMRVVHSAGSPGTRHESRPGDGAVAAALPALEVACRLAPPWAFLAGGRLVGLEVLALEHYAELTGRSVNWQICDAEAVLERIRSGQAVLGIGGLPESLARRGGGRPLLASSRRIPVAASESSPRERHVWATGHLPAAELWRLRAYLLWKRLRGFGRQ
jgi:hypothetical protein